MKKILALATTLLLFGSPALAGQFGPALAQVKPGQVALGLGVFAYADDWDFEGITADTRQTQVFLQGSLGLFPNWETYLRIGAADLRIDSMVNGSDFRDSFQPYGTLGLKGLFRQGKYLDLGGFVEGSYFLDYEDSAGASKLEIDNSFAVNAGVTLQKVIEGALLYGGPFFHYREGDFDFSNFSVTPASGSGSFEEDGSIGGFIGIRWYALDDLVIEGEVQVRDGVSAGGAVSFLF